MKGMNKYLTYHERLEENKLKFQIFKILKMFWLTSFST
jgi:hypothetical protein